MLIKNTTRKEIVKWKGWESIKHLDELLNIQNGECGHCKSTLKFPRKNNFAIHHIDRNRENNNISNLILLCTPCHKKEHKTYWNTKLKLQTGYSFVELKSLGISYLKGVYKWDEIKTNPRAVYISNGLGRIKNLPCKKTYGYSQREIGDFFGLTHQSIQQLQSRDSIRFYTMVAIMNHPLMKELCPSPLTDAIRCDRMLGMDELLDYIKEISRDAQPMFQIDPATGRVYRREREIWDVYEEAKK